jgi:phytoene synthase
MNPNDYCQNLAARRGSDFHYSLLGQPPALRQTLIAVQAFYLETTQIAEECHDPSVARDKLDWWRTEAGHLFNGEPHHPVTCALRPQLAAFNLPEEYFREILDGVAMDLEYDVYPSFTELTLYLHRLGSTPALLTVEILGYQDRRSTPRFAHEVGGALLLFDRLYEARRYAQLGRCYSRKMTCAGSGWGRVICWPRRPPSGFSSCSPFRPNGFAIMAAGRWNICRRRNGMANPAC